MKRFILIIFCLLLNWTFTLQAQTLDEYLMEAAEENPGIKASYLQFEVAMQRVSQVNSLPDPNLSFGYFISPVETRVGPQRAKISLSQMFPWFGTLKAQKNVAGLLAEIRYQEFLNAKNELYYKVKKAYYPVYEINEHIRWHEENLKILNTYKSLALSSFSNAKGTMVDVIRVDIMIENTKNDIQLLNDRLKPIQTSFNKLLNRPDSLAIIISDSLMPFNLQDNYRKDSLLAGNPILQAMDLQIGAASAEEELARKKGSPHFSLGIDYSIISPRTDLDGGSMEIPGNGKNALMPMISMSLPIFRGKYKALIKEAQLSQNAWVLAKLDIENSLLSSYEMTWYELEEADNYYLHYNEQIEKTQMAIKLLYTAYSNSGKDFEEVLRMQQQLLKYEISKATEIKKYYTALARLDYLTSK